MDYEKNQRIRKDLIDFLEELSKLGKNTNFDKWSKSDCAEWIAWIKSKHATGKLKECMYAKDHYTDEDRKVLCDGCEEECKYAQKEEPATSVWHDISEEANLSEFVLLYDEKDGYMSPPSRFPFKDMLGFVDAMNRKYGANYTKWAYKDDILKL